MRDTAAMSEFNPSSPQRTARRGAISMALFWALLAGVLFAVFKWLEERERAPLQPYTTDNGELVIPRHRDGHFYVPGEVNRVPVQFLVDTGASAVSISDDQAQQARLPQGRPITLQTANGERPGRIMHNIPVRVGPLSFNQTTVVTGLVGLPANQALLGQSFLRQFDVQLRQHDMVLRPRQP
jgi:aspartyl protease family protein